MEKRYINNPSLKPTNKTMKHLLIILISFLLLSSPVIGNSHKGEILYLWVISSTLEWKTFGEKGTHPIYKGDVENGKPNGVGITNYLGGNKYFGEWKDGKQDGIGTFTWSEGTMYQGEWKNGRYNGQGTETSSDGTMYEGEWKDGISNGQGTFTWSDGKKFVGEFKDGKLWNGTSYFKNGQVIGQIINGHPK
jgi:hypothetical protein